MIIQPLTEDLISITGSPKLQEGLWVLCRVRKATKCAATGADILPKQEAWRPLGNGLQRAQRLSLAAVGVHL